MRTAVLACLAALVLAGCGGTKSGSLEDAADATAADTSRVEYTFHVEAGPNGDEATFHATGVFDYPKERGVMVVDEEIPFFPEDVKMKEFRVLGRSGYIRWVVKGKPYWVQDDVEPTEDPVELLIPGPGTATKPTDVLTRVLLASEENEKVGTEDVRGTETTHYRARVSLAKLRQQLPLTESDSEVKIWQDEVVAVDLWIDDESRLRKLAVNEPDQKADPGMTATVELYDYGVEVAVEPPPEAETISNDEFGRLTSFGEGWTTYEDGGSTYAGDTPEELCEAFRKDLPKTEADRLCEHVKEGK